jgi:hypothetical protein
MEGEHGQKCSKYHAKRQVLVPNCCKYKANGTMKENHKKIQNLRQTKYQKLFYGRISGHLYTLQKQYYALNQPSNILTGLHGSATQTLCSKSGFVGVMWSTQSSAIPYA